jgi:hypothetical protein
MGNWEIEENLRDGFLNPVVKLEWVDGIMSVTLDDGNCDTTGRGRLGQWDGRGEEGKESEDKRV